MRASTATAAGRAKREWAQPNARDEVMLFDPNLGRFDQQFQSWREHNHAMATKSEDRESQRVKRSMFGKKGAVDLWQDPQKHATHTFDAFQKQTIERDYTSRILGPSIYGQRQQRAAPELLAAAPMETMSDEAVAVLARIVGVAQADGASARALWYVPRALVRLQRWAPFVRVACTLSYLIEAAWERGLGEVELLIASAARDLEAVRRSSAVFLSDAQEAQQARPAASL